AAGLPSEETREGDWRTRLTRIHDEMLQSYLRHPWALEIPVSGVPLTPNTAAWMDAGLEALADTPLTDIDRIGITLIVVGHARWAGMVKVGYARMAADGDQEIAAQEDAAFRTLITAEAY